MEIKESSAVDRFSVRDPHSLNADPDPASALGNDAYKKKKNRLYYLHYNSRQN
jgi:hypothetical protein